MCVCAEQKRPYYELLGQKLFFVRFLWWCYRRNVNLTDDVREKITQATHICIALNEL